MSSAVFPQQLPQLLYTQWKPVALAAVIAILSWAVLLRKHEDLALPFYVPVPFQCAEGYWDDHDALAEENSELEMLEVRVVVCGCKSRTLTSSPLGRRRRQ